MVGHTTTLCITPALLQRTLDNFVRTIAHPVTYAIEAGGDAGGVETRPRNIAVGDYQT